MHLANSTTSPALSPPFNTVEKITPILDALQSSGVKQLDTARLYGQGFSEPLLTESGYAERGMNVSTKLYSTQPPSAPPSC